MKVIIDPGRISGTITAPPSKSLTQRALAAALLHKGTTIIHNAGNSADELAALLMIQQLGATVTQRTTENGLLQLTITSSGIAPVTNEINAGESGLAARLFIPIAALHSSQLTVKGSGSLRGRPMQGIEDAFSKLNVSLNAFNGYLPLHVNGPMRATSLRMDAGGSSQFVSGLLFALSECARELITLEVSGLESTPYIDLTLDVLARFGKPISHNRYRKFIIDPSLFTYAPTVEISVEADWSSASCLLVAGAIAGDITVTNLNPDSRQADKALLDVLKNAGATITTSVQSITVQKNALQPFDFDASNCPDLFPALAALAAFCPGESNIRGIHRLFHKESNRVESITEMLWRFGIHFSAEDDILTIEGRENAQWAYIDGYNDHRIVMAAAVCALRTKGAVTITTADAVKKSYPAFFEDLGKCGVKYSLF